jgi:hypothetical protein
VVAAASSVLLFLATGENSASGQVRTNPIVRARLEQPFTLRIGQSAQVESMKITFLRVAQDSRCPTDVFCFWQGDAEVELLVIHPETGRRRVTLHTTLTPKQGTVAGYLVRLNRLAPYPKTTSPIPLRDYRATLTVREARP